MRAGGLWIIPAVLLFATSATAMSPLCGPADDPCVVTSDLTLPDQSLFDLGGRAFVLAAGRTITVRDDGNLKIAAGSIVLQSNARILANGVQETYAVGGSIDLESASDIELGPGTAIDVGNWDAGFVTLLAQGGVRLLGSIRATASSRDGSGGYVTVQNTGDDTVRVAGDGVRVTGGNRYGGGGAVEITTGGDLEILAPLVSRGGEGGGGTIELFAVGDITSGPLGDLDTTQTFAADGSFTYLTSEDGTVTLDGRILAPGSGTGGGYGGDVDVYGRRGVTIRGDIDVDGESQYGHPGLINVSAPLGPVVLDSNITGRGHPEWEWAELRIEAGGDVTVDGLIDFSGAYGYAALAVVTRFRIRIDGRVVLTGANRSGELDLTGCDVDVSPGAEIDWRLVGAGSDSAFSIIEAGGLVSIGGTLRASKPLDVYYRDTPPVVLPGGSVTPPLVLHHKPDIRCCHCAPICGDGRVDDGELCDDGNLVDGDCCSSACQAEPADGACDDGSTCTTDDVCDGAGACEGVPLACDVCERCDEGVGCVVGPEAACSPIVVPGSGQIDIKDRTPDAGDSVVWQWRRGAVTPLHAFGDPVGATDFALCVFTGPTDLLLRARVPHGGSCGGRSCWKPIGTRGFSYANASGTPDGIYKMKLLAGPAGKASIMLKGRGAALPTAPLGSVAMPVTVQLQASHGSCWESVHSIASVNVPAQLKAKSD